ncbi:hypothetical protein [Thomasclavelia saccharogumia]|uniref:hypothetical protein n=1 Tax=Thomasclavelia saccharogumia TaxID=341225 RepID=UPI00047999C8|nr:hypothetical protein [Thomasclavelia saccharogumia]
MKKFIIIILSFILCACTTTSSSSNQKEAVIELQPGNGAVKKIPMQDVFDKMANDETFVVLLSQTYCNACLNFFMETDAYTEEIGLTLWDIILDDEKTSEEENLKLINEKLGDFSTTPSIYYVENGKVKDSLCASNEKVDLESYKKFLIDNNIIEDN